MNKMPLFETSAKDDNRADHVEAIFITLAHKIATFKKPIMNDEEAMNTIYIEDDNRSAVKAAEAGSNCCT